MLIYTEHNTLRLQYILAFIFGDVFGTEYRLTENREEFINHKGARINYSSAPLDGSFRIPVSGLLEEDSIRELDPGLDISGSMPVLFHSKDPRNGGTGTNISGLGFDLFAAVFYMISRYEEYLPFEPDKHGRFESSASIAGRNGFLELPVVDLWLEDLREKLQEKFRDLRLHSGEFRFLPTCDIDLPYAYLHRGKARTFGARIRAAWQANADRDLRKEVLSGISPDPYDTFAEIEEIHALYKIRSRLFFLTAPYGKFDRSISPKGKAFRNLVEQCGKFADLGLHPSYRSSGNPALLQKEVRMLSGLTGESITSSRQHFLKFRLPGNYRDYLEAGIREEYSMGFASAAGFRAGTSRPFLFYDLLREEQTSLKVVPFHVMDRTLKDYMHLSPRQALDRIMEIAAVIRSVRGTFVSIWHNDAFSDFGEWNGWKDVYLQMLDTAIS